MPTAIHVYIFFFFLPRNNYFLHLCNSSYYFYAGILIKIRLSVKNYSEYF